MKTEPVGKAVLIAWLAAAVFYFYQYVMRSAPAVMIPQLSPYTVIKEANPPHLSGTATGVVNFLNFTFSALMGPVFASMLFRAGAEGMDLDAYQTTLTPLLYSVGLAIVLTLLLEETGPAARQPTLARTEI